MSVAASSTPAVGTPAEPPETRWNPRWLAALTIVAAAGVLVVAIAYDGARKGESWADPVFWAGLLIIVLPITLRLCGREASRHERLALVLITGMALYAIKVLLSPNAFTLHDELGHYRSVNDVLRTGSLYLSNPLVPAYAYYPGILTLTASLSRMSGLSIFSSGVIVVGVARLLLMGGLFLLIQRVTRSSRIAGVASMLYAANPNFVFFDSEFAYESLALGLAAMTLWAVARVVDERDSGWPEILIAALLDCALVLSHHLTSYAVAIVITAWALLAALRRPSSKPERRHTSKPSIWGSYSAGPYSAGPYSAGPYSRDAPSPVSVSAAAKRRLAFLAVFSLAITTAYAIYAYTPTSSDIGASLTGSIHGLVSVVNGSLVGKAPFTTAHGYHDPPLEVAAGLASVALLLVALPFGLYVLWRRRPVSSGLLILGIAALFYPISLALRLTAAGTETSNRTSEFVFAGLGTILALAFLVALTWQGDGSRAKSLAIRLAATVYVGIVFVGGITVGTPSYNLLPAGYEVSAEARSIDPEGVAAAKWVHASLPSSTHVLADTVDTSLITAYTALIPENGQVQGMPIGALFEDQKFGARERKIITVDKLSFLIIDRRDSTALPVSGRYFEGSDPIGSYSTPISASALAKFDAVRCIDRIFSSGNLVVYDTRPILRGCR